MLKVCSSRINFYKFTPYYYNIPFFMKTFTNVLVFLAIGLIIFNITLIDFKNPFEGNSMIAFIGIAASFCAVLILLIFKMSKCIEEKMNDKF